MKPARTVNSDPNGQSRSGIRISHPSGLLRLFFRAPILLYRLGLGSILGNRFLLLEHRGRRSGILRRTVLEVVDGDPRAGWFVVAAAWGERADWYRNLRADPFVRLTVSSRRMLAHAVPVPQEDAWRHLRKYAGKHPTSFKLLTAYMFGRSSRGVEETIAEFVSMVPFVVFKRTAFE